MTTFGESAPAELLFEEFGFTVATLLRSKSAAVIGKMLCEKGRQMRPFRLLGKVRVVYAGCGVNALSVLQDFANSTYCRKYVGLISVAHQAVLSLLSISRAAKAPFFT